VVDEIGNAESHQESEEDSSQEKAGVLPIHGTILGESEI
jgi:hypothetical protein